MDLHATDAFSITDEELLDFSDEDTTETTNLQHDACCTKDESKELQLLEEGELLPNDDSKELQLLEEGPNGMENENWCKEENETWANDNEEEESIAANEDWYEEPFGSTVKLPIMQNPEWKRAVKICNSKSSTSLALPYLVASPCLSFQVDLRWGRSFFSMNEERNSPDEVIAWLCSTDDAKQKLLLLSGKPCLIDSQSYVLGVKLCYLVAEFYPLPIEVINPEWISYYCGVSRKAFYHQPYYYSLAYKSKPNKMAVLGTHRFPPMVADSGRWMRFYTENIETTKLVTAMNNLGWFSHLPRLVVNAKYADVNLRFGGSIFSMNMFINSQQEKMYENKTKFSNALYLLTGKRLLVDRRSYLLGVALIYAYIEKLPDMKNNAGLNNSQISYYLGSNPQYPQNEIPSYWQMINTLTQMQIDRLYSKPHIKKHHHTRWH